MEVLRFCLYDNDTDEISVQVFVHVRVLYCHVATV